MSSAGVWAAPGRVNVIGEHTDYSDGLVLPMALPQVCRMSASPRSDGVVRVGSAQQPSFDWQEHPVSVSPGDVEGWAAYVLGLVWALRRSGHEIPGAELFVDSEVPLGAGLSSSAAVGCSTAAALRDLFSVPASDLDLAALARESENEFVGAPTGAMDQAISMLGRRDHLLFLDTRDMSFDHVPFALSRHGLCLLVIDSRVRHELNDGGYASVRAAVEAGTAQLGVPALRDVPVGDLDSLLPELEPQVAGPVRHVVTENDRVLQVVSLLRDGGDPRRIGPLLVAGHESLRDDLGVSTPELDLAVAAAVGAGAAGARMTGGGFGGSVIALVDDAGVGDVRVAVDDAYAAAGLVAPGYLVAQPADGARRLR